MKKKFSIFKDTKKRWAKSIFHIKILVLKLVLLFSKAANSQGKNVSLKIIQYKVKVKMTIAKKITKIKII